MAQASTILNKIITFSTLPFNVLALFCGYLLSEQGHSLVFLVCCEFLSQMVVFCHIHFLHWIKVTKLFSLHALIKKYID